MHTNPTDPQRSLKVQVICLWVAVVLIAGCVPAFSHTAPRVSIKVVYSSTNPDVLPGWVAQDGGFFDRNGLDVEFLNVEGGVRATQALISKDAAFGFLAPISPINANAAGADFVLIAGIVNTLPYDIVVIPELKRGADIKGKRFAVSAMSGGSYAAMRFALRRLYKLNPDRDVTPVEIGADDAREHALVLRQVDAAMLHPAMAGIVERDGLVILDHLWDKGIEYQFTSVVTSKGFLKDNPDLGLRFVKSIIQATGYVKDPANKDEVLKTLRKYLKKDDAATLESSYQWMTDSFLRCAPYVSLEGLKPVIADSKPAVEKGLTPEQLVDNSFVKMLDDDGFIKEYCR